MDVGRQTDLQEERMDDRRSLSSNYRYCSQSRKISVGVLVDSISKDISKDKTKDLQEPGVPIAETETCGKRNCANDRERHTPLKEKHVIVEPKDASPWVSTRSFNPNKSSSVAVQDTERTPSFPTCKKTRPRSKLLEKASEAHSLRFFTTKSDLGSDNCGRKVFGQDTFPVEAGKADNVEDVENTVRSTEQGFRLEKEQIQVKERTTETGGRETLRMKLWEILGDVSSPNKHLPNHQSDELHPDQERNRKQSPIGKINLTSDTIESDSQTQNFTRPTTRSLTRRKASIKKQSKASETTKTIDIKECRQKRIFSFKGDRSGGLYDNLNDSSVPRKKKKTLRVSSETEKLQSFKPKIVEERQQSEKSRSTIPAAKNVMVHKNKVSNASSSSDRRKDAVVEPKTSDKNNASFEFSPNETTDQRDAHQSMDKASKKNLQEEISISLLKKKRNPSHVPLSPPSEIKSHGSLETRKKEQLRGQSPAEKMFSRTSIRSFQSFLSPKPADPEPDFQQEVSVGRYKQKNSPKRSHLVKPSTAMDKEGYNRMSKSSTEETDSESSEDGSKKDLLSPDRREAVELSPEIRLPENTLPNSDKSPGHDEDVGVIGSSPASDSLKEMQEASDLEIELEDNHEDGLTRAVTLFTKALVHIKTKLKSLSSRRSADILRAAVEEIFLQLQNAESLIKTDVGKLTNMSHSKGKQLETRFQEKQEQLLEIHKRFKAEVEQHLQDCGSLIEDLEEHQLELKRSVEKQRVVHKKFLSQLEQEINVQLEDAESRIMAVEKMAREKMLQLKLGVAECLKHSGLS